MAASRLKVANTNRHATQEGESGLEYVAFNCGEAWQSNVDAIYSPMISRPARFLVFAAEHVGYPIRLSERRLRGQSNNGVTP